MAITYNVTANRKKQRFQRIAYEGGAETITINYAPWAAVNGTVTTVTWALDRGNAAISGEALASNVATALISTPSQGRSLIKVTATDGTNIDKQYIEIQTTDPGITYDYGFSTIV